MCWLYKSHQIARLVTHLINHVSKLIITVQQDNVTKFGCKNGILHIFLFHLATYFGYITMGSCIV